MEDQPESRFWLDEVLSPHDVYRHGLLRVMHQQATAFQEMLVVESATYGKALILDGKWQTSVADEFLYHEPIAHLPLCLAENPRRVLIAGGADGGAAREVLKWRSVTEVTIADIDGEVIDACRDLLPEIHQGSLRDARTQIVVGDAFELIRNATSRWDVIIADLTDPIDSGPAAALFSKEFFVACHHALTPDGVFVNQAGCSAPPLAGPLIRVARSVRDVFGNARMVPVFVPTYGAPWGFVLACRNQKCLAQSPSAAAIDGRLAAAGVGKLKCFSGGAAVGLLSTPAYLQNGLV